MLKRAGAAAERGGVGGGLSTRLGRGRVTVRTVDSGCPCGTWNAGQGPGHSLLVSLALSHEARQSQHCQGDGRSRPPAPPPLPAVPGPAEFPKAEVAR